MILSKIDVLPPEDREARLQELRDAGYEAHAISAVSGEGLKGLLERVWGLLASSFVTPVERDDDRS